MSASMAEVLAEHQLCVAWEDAEQAGITCLCGLDIPLEKERGEIDMDALAAHQASVLAANGYGKLDATKFVLAEREAELLNLKGPCSNAQCPLHFAHRGPCDLRRPE